MGSLVAMNRTGTNILKCRKLGCVSRRENTDGLLSGGSEDCPEVIRGHH